MTMRAPTPHWLERFPALKDGLAQLQQRWDKLAERERRLLLGLALALGLLLVWLVLISPALKSLNGTRDQLTEMDAQWTQMQDDAVKARSLRSAAPVSPDEANAALRAATDRLGKDARLTLQGERATLNFSNLPGTALADWLVEVRTGARARATEANLNRSNATYSGTVVLTLPSR